MCRCRFLRSSVTDKAPITGEASTAASYREVAGEIVEAARGHYNGEYIYECHGREKDGAVIHAIITFGE